MKFTTLIPMTRNDGRPLAASELARLVDSLWRPFGDMTNEGVVEGHWIDDDGTHCADRCVKVAIECERDALPAALRAVRRIGRKLDQRAMYFEVAGYDGVQILRIE